MQPDKLSDKFRKLLTNNSEEWMFTEKVNDEVTFEKKN